MVGPVYELALAAGGLVVRNLFLAAGLLVRRLEPCSRCSCGPPCCAGAPMRALALGAALFMATNATFFRYGYSVTTDALALALQSAALFVLLARPGLRAAAGAGVLAALAFLTRYNAGVLLPAGLVAIAARRARCSESARPRGAAVRRRLPAARRCPG